MPPAEQAAYLHLIRLSFGEGRNWCRVAKRELQERLRLSERPLLRVLDGLVARGLARPLHRDNRGTLWRVCLPREAAGAAGRGRGADGPGRRAEAGARGRARGRLPAPASPRGRSPRGRWSGRWPRRAASWTPPGWSGPRREIAELLAEGQTPRRIAAGIEAVRRRARAPAQGSTP